jgi:kinetochore protein Mis12/MTW1
MLDILAALPPKFLAMYQTMSSLPPPETLPATVDLSEPGKRQWETNKMGYMNWVLGRLLTKGATKEGMGHGPVDKVDLAASEVGTGEELRRALDAVGVMKRNLAAVLPPEGDVDDRMEE